MPEREPRPEVAFQAAVLALLVLPLLVVVGLAAFGLAVSYVIPPDRLMNGSAFWLLAAIFVVWVLVAVGIVLTLAARLTKRSTRF